MECIVQLDKTEYFERSKEIVKEMYSDDLSEELLDIVTNEIMDTCNFIGGDFEEASIRDITQQYIDTNALDRIKRVRGL